MNEPKVSVLMSVCNSGDIVRTAIESILEQTFTDFEFVIVNDGSTDDTQKHMDKYSDPRIRRIRLESNTGLTRALNTGLRACRGEYIARMDADDYCHPARLEKQVALMDAHPEYGASGTGFWWNDNGRVRRHLPPALIPRDRPPEELAGCIAHSSAMIRRDALLTLGGYDCNFRYAQDFKLWVDMRRAGWDIGAVRELLVTYNRHAGQLSVVHAAEQKACADRIREYVRLPRVGVLVIARNRLDVTAKAVEQLIENTPQPYTLYLFNNGSDDATGEYFEALASRHDFIRAYHSTENHGCPGGREYMMRKIDNDYVAWIDDDMFVEPGWLPPLAAKLDADSRIAAATMLWSHHGKYKTNMGGVITPLTGDHAHIHPNTDPARTDDLAYFSGGASLIRRAAYNWSAPFGDPPGYAEDIYLGFAFRRDGWRICGVPESKGEHRTHGYVGCNQYRSGRRVGGAFTRSAADRIKDEFGLNPIRNDGWAASCGARLLLLFPPLPPASKIAMGLPPSTFPMGLAFIAAYLRQRGQSVRLIDYRVENPPLERAVADYDPDWVGVYCTSVGWEYTVEFMRRLRGMTKSPIVAGGPHASLTPERIPDFVDHIVCGEGEYAFWNLIDSQDTTRIIRAERIKDLDALPWPDWRELAEKPYARTDNEGFGLENVALINTSRGCPYSCRFCSGRKVFKRGYRAFSPEKVREAVRGLKSAGYESIYFREDNFTARKQRAVDIATVMGQEGMRWACETRVDTLDRGAVFHMARNGCAGFYIGVESGSQSVLDAMNKRIKIAQIERFFRWCREAGIRTYASVITGFPGETEADIQATDMLLERIKPDKVCRNVFLGMPGSDSRSDLLDAENVEWIDEGGLVYPEGFTKRRAALYGSAV